MMVHSNNFISGCFTILFSGSFFGFPKHFQKPFTVLVKVCEVEGLVR